METKDNLIKPEVVKNEHYQAMLSLLDNAIKGWNNFSRLDRLEYAYKCLELAIQYNCSTHNLDASTIIPALELLDHRGETHTVQTPDGKTQSVVTISIRETLAAFKFPPERILSVALHETKHACDAQSMERPYFDNKPNMGQVKVGDPILPSGYNDEISKSYKEFGIAWQGKDLEISANETAYSVTNSLLEDLLAQNPNSISLQTRVTKFSNETTKHLATQHKASEDLKVWKEELLQKYAPEGLDKLPVVTESMIQTDFVEPTHPFVDIETIREVAEQNPEIFKEPNFVSKELDGATTKAEADEKGPEVAQAFIQNNNTVVQKFEQAITPQTTLGFMPNTPTMELN